MHLVGIVLSAGFTYADVHRMQISGLVELIYIPLIFVALLSLLICPVLMLLALARSNASPEKKFGVFFLELALVAIHCFVLLPAVQ